MFGVDFSELVVILVITLIVVGPERLPKVARTLGHLWGRLQRYVNSVKADVSREMAAEEFRLMQQKLKQEAMSLEQAVKQEAASIEQTVKQAATPDSPPAGSAAAPSTARSEAPADVGLQLAQPAHAPEQNKP